jgi:GTPase SAR1 family protein
MGQKNSKAKKGAAAEPAKQENMKLLLLGTGESGKSAVFKQMKELYGKKFTPAELAEYKNAIHNNITEGMKLLCEGTKTLELSDDVVAKAEMEAFLSSDLTENSLNVASTMEGKTVGDLVAILWKDPGIQKAWEKRRNLQIVESHRVFFEEIDRINNPAYAPTFSDVIYSRVRSSGVITEKFDISGQIFELYDVGGQRNERKKWIHIFDNVDGIIFICALIDYDQLCFEDEQTNRMIESLNLFKWIAQHELFQNMGMLMFLNKKDIFREKLKEHPINSVSHFEDYAGGEDFDKACEYFKAKFEAIAKEKNPNRTFYCHYTCAADNTNVKQVFEDCKAILTSNALKNSGAV